MCSAIASWGRFSGQASGERARRKLADCDDVLKLSLSHVETFRRASSRIRNTAAGQHRAILARQRRSIQRQREIGAHASGLLNRPISAPTLNRRVITAEKHLGDLKGAELPGFGEHGVFEEARTRVRLFNEGVRVSHKSFEKTRQQPR